MKASRDLLVYFALCALPIASFLLSGYPETQFYISLLMVSLVVIIWFRHYYQETSQIVDYDENLDLRSLLFVAGGTGAILLLSSVLIGALTKSLIYVPIHKLGLEYGQIIVPSLYSDALFQLTLVSPAEECTKLVVMLALFLWFAERFGKGFASVMAVGLSVGGWAMLHTFRAYTGQYSMIMVLAAFGAGLIMFLVMKKTKSLLASILVHAAYNIIVTYLTYQMS